MMRALTITGLLMLAVPVCADWYGFPLSENTNGDWYTIRETVGPITQQWAAVVERYDAGRPSEDPGSAIGTWDVIAGTSNEVIVTTNIVGGTTNLYTFTNTLLLEMEVKRTVDVSVASRRLIGPFEYSYTDASGTHTSTCVPWLEGDQYTLLDDTQLPLLAYMDYTMYHTRDGEYDAPVAHRYVCTNEWDGTNYTTWFLKTDASGDYPQGFPMNTGVGLASREGIGYVTNRITNAWGFVVDGISPATPVRHWWWTQYPTNEDHWLLGELHYSTNQTWDFAYGGNFATNVFATNATPVLIYTGTNVGLTTTVYGSCIDGTNFWVFGGDIPWQGTKATTETVTVSIGTNAMTERWLTITNMVCSKTGTLHEAQAVVQTNPAAVFARYPGETLYNETFDERYQLLKALIWTTEDNDDWETGVSNQYKWTGVSAVSWAAAKANCVTAAPVIASGSLDPGAMTEGKLNAGQWTAIARVRQTTGILKTIPTNFGHSVEFYIRAAIYPNVGVTSNLFFDYAGGLLEDGFTYSETIAETYQATVTGALNYGQVTFPASWCAEPSTNGSTAKGYTLTDIIGLVKWDGTNGFEYLTAP